MFEDDEFGCEKRIDAAVEAESYGEVLIGACLIADGELFVFSRKSHYRGVLDPNGARGNFSFAGQPENRYYRLTETALYTTIELQAMCAPARSSTRVKRRLVFGGATNVSARSKAFFSGFATAVL